ncbi:ALQxL family class IV lanthipeptide [Streptosporangium sp. NPDC005286]
MELDIDALDMLPAAKETQLYPCSLTCTVTCDNNHSCLVTERP